MSKVACCNKCQHKQWGAGVSAGAMVMLCGVDGVPVGPHRAADYCPQKCFGSDAKPEGWDKNPTQVADATARAKAYLPGPGDLVKRVLAAMGYTLNAQGELQCPGGASIKECGCESMRMTMNQWGYLECVRRRREILEWFMAKAALCGIDVQSVRSLVWRGLLAGKK